MAQTGARAGNVDLQALASLSEFFKTYWDYRDTPNRHLFHYSDMKRDLRGAIARMADALKITVGGAQLDAFAEASDFGAMKKKAEQFAPDYSTETAKAESPDSTQPGLPRHQ